MNQNNQLEQNRSRVGRRSNGNSQPENQYQNQNQSQTQNQSQNQDQNQHEPVLKPAYDIQEMDEAWGLTAHLPGATKDSVEISAEQGRFVVRARRAWKKPETWSTVYRETVDAAYELVLEHENLIAADKIHAELKNGVLRVSLPKAEAIKPRKISVS